MSVRSTHIKLKLTSTVAVALLLCVSAATQAQQKPEQLAQKSAEAWLVLVDSGKYAQSWDEAAEFFKSAVTKDQWQSALGTARTPQGKVLSRTLKSATYTKTLPNAPDGEYVVIQYDTNFEHKQAAVETVVPMREKDGDWRVSGYFIK